MADCLFCKIASKEIKSEIVYEDESVIAFNDISPRAPVHVLIIPKKHVPAFTDIEEGDKDLLFSMQKAALKIAGKKDLKDGFRLVVNNGPDAGQVVLHLHYHLLGGKKMGWTPA